MCIYVYRDSRIKYRGLEIFTDGTLNYIIYNNMEAKRSADTRSGKQVNLSW